MARRGILKTSATLLALALLAGCASTPQPSIAPAPTLSASPTAEAEPEPEPTIEPLAVDDDFENNIEVIFLRKLAKMEVFSCSNPEGPEIGKIVVQNPNGAYRMQNARTVCKGLGGTMVINRFAQGQPLEDILSWRRDYEEFLEDLTKDGIISWASGLNSKDELVQVHVYGDILKPLNEIAIGEALCLDINWYYGFYNMSSKIKQPFTCVV
jgi:hypothetical protein